MRIRSVKDAAEYYKTYDVENRIKQDKAHLVEFFLSMNFIKKYIKKKVTAIDVGCGTGNYSIALAKKCKKILAVDLMDNLLEILKQKVKKDHCKNISCLCADILDIPKLTNEKFDLILCMGPLYHLNNLATRTKCFNNIKRLAHDKSIIIFTYLTTSAILSSVFKGKLLFHDFIKLINKKRFYNKPFYFTSPDYIEKEIKKNSFTIIEHVPLDPISSFCGQQVNSLEESNYNDFVATLIKTSYKRKLLGLSSHNMLITMLKK